MKAGGGRGQHIHGSHRDTDVSPNRGCHPAQDSSACMSLENLLPNESSTLPGPKPLLTLGVPAPPPCPGAAVLPSHQARKGPAQRKQAGRRQAPGFPSYETLCPGLIHRPAATPAGQGPHLLTEKTADACVCLCPLCALLAAEGPPLPQPVTLAQRPPHWGEIRHSTAARTATITKAGPGWTTGHRAGLGRLLVGPRAPGGWVAAEQGARGSAQPLWGSEPASYWTEGLSWARIPTPALQLDPPTLGRDASPRIVHRPGDPELARVPYTHPTVLGQGDS